MALCGDEANSVCYEEPERQQHQTGAREQGTQDRSVESGHREEWLRSSGVLALMS